MTLLFPAILLILMYMLLIRPQQQRVRKQRALVTSLAVGDRVVSIGGIVGVIATMDDEFIELDTGDGRQLTFLRQAISRKLDPTDGAGAADLTDDDHTDEDDGAGRPGPVPGPVDDVPATDDIQETGA